MCAARPISRRSPASMPASPAVWDRMYRPPRPCSTSRIACRRCARGIQIAGALLNHPNCNPVRMGVAGTHPSAYIENGKLGALYDSIRTGELFAVLTQMPGSPAG